jgi:hypothetical protein
MRTSNAVVGLSALIAVLALVAAGIGLFYGDGGSPFTFTSLRGQPVEIYGQGLYRYDTLFQGAGNKGTDMVTLFLGIPLLVLSVLLYRRGSLRGGLLLMGALTWFLYTYASYALGPVAYNDLFLLYVALFSASLFALVLTFRSFDVRALPARFSARLPRRGLAIFMFVSAFVTLVVWLVAPTTALLQGEPPERLDTYTTLFTNALDLAIIVPIVFLAGVLILRRDPLGYVIAFPLLVLEAFLAPMIAAQTVSQLRARVTFPPGQIVGPIGGFATIAVVAIWVIVILLRNVSDPATSGAPHVR